MGSEIKRLICVSCGGELQQSLFKVYCPYCKNTYEKVNKITEEEIIALNRATTDRNLFRFDEAWEEYNLLTTKYPHNEMAHWGALLCDYGIVYEKDYDGKLVPTCHRLSERPIEKSPNYSHLSKDHLKRASEIEALRNSIIEKANSVAPYDVFICYKATDDYHGRPMPTKESVWARDLYDLLTHELKLNVFFAEKSLQGSNVEYEPHIYSALNSAKIMFVLAETLDHVNAIWVKNEWKRYSKYIQEGQPKTIRVIYDNIEPYDLPRELQKNQAINHNSISWVNAVKSAIEAIFKKPEPPKPVADPKPKRTTTPKPKAPPKPKTLSADEAYNLGYSYFNGVNGKKKDFTKAVEYYKIAANVGHAGAQNNLGWCIENGYGTAIDKVAAVSWYRLAANQGNAWAQSNLGYCLYHGIGTAINYTEAVHWYTVSANKGIVDSINNLGNCYENGKGVPRNINEAIRLYRIAASKGNQVAKNNLARLGVYY